MMNTEVREIDHKPRTRVVVTPDMVTFHPGAGQHSLEMTEGGVQSLASFIKLPAHLLTQLRPETLGQVSTELLGRKNQYALVVKDKAVTGLIKRGVVHTLNPERVVNIVGTAVRGMEFHRVLILDDFVVSLEIVGERRQAVNSGDLIRAGANITFSPLGTVNPMVQSYALRLLCTNGITGNTILREFTYGHGGGGGGTGGGGGGEGDDIWQWFRESTRAAYQSLDKLVTRYRQMMAEEISPADRSMLLTALLREAKITGKEAEAIRAMALENPPQNSYDMMNLMTAASSHVIENPGRVRRTQLAVASYTSTDEHARVCPVCHARRN